MIFIGNFKKYLYIFVISVAKPKNFVVFAFMYTCVKKPCAVEWQFCMNLYSVDSDEAMKQGDEAFNGSSL
jgi:hypothetical protein